MFKRISLLLAAALSLAFPLMLEPVSAQQINQTVAVCDPANPTNCMTGGSGGLNPQVQGNVASGATDTGNPVKVGGVVLTSDPTYSNGQRADFRVGINGAQVASPTAATLTNADNIANAVTSIGVVNAAGATAIGNVRVFPMLFNSATWDREFTCSSNAVVNVAAGATTQLVALSGATNIRVCSFAITESLAGTAKFVSGTGASCATGTADITGAMAIGTTGNVSLSAANGSLFRAGASNALCLTAVTGNITGFISYTQF